MQTRGEQLAEEHAELVGLRHELNQRDRELSRRATEQATEAANTQVCHVADYHAKLKHFTLSSACGGNVTQRCSLRTRLDCLVAQVTASCFAALVDEILGFSMHVPEVGHCYSQRCSWTCHVLDDSLTPCIHRRGFYCSRA